MHTQNWYYSRHFILRLGFSVVVVFAACAIIDMLRQNLLEKPLFRLQILKKFTQKVDTMLLEQGPASQGTDSMPQQQIQISQKTNLQI